MNRKILYLRLHILCAVLMAPRALTAMNTHNESALETPITSSFWATCKKMLSLLQESEKHIPPIEKHSNEDIAQDALSLAQALCTTHATIGFTPLAHVFHDAYLRFRHAIIPARNFVPETDPLKTLPPTSRILTQQLMHYIKTNHSKEEDTAYGKNAIPLPPIQNISEFATGYQNHDACLTQGPFKSPHFKEEVLKKIIEPQLKSYIGEYEVGPLPWWGRMLHNIPNVQRDTIEFDTPLFIRTFPLSAFMRTLPVSATAVSIMSAISAHAILSKIINSLTNKEEASLEKSIPPVVLDDLQKRLQELQKLSDEFDKIRRYHQIMLKNIFIPWLVSMSYKNDVFTVRLRQNTFTSHLYTGAVATAAHFATQKILSRTSPGSRLDQYGLLPWWSSPILYGLRYWQACRINQQYAYLNAYNKIHQVNNFHNKVTDLALIGMRCYSIAAPACRLVQHGIARYVSK